MAPEEGGEVNVVVCRECALCVENGYKTAKKKELVHLFCAHRPSKNALPYEHFFALLLGTNVED